MDLSKLKPSERFIEILNPATDVELGVKVSILSINDDKLKKIKRKIQDDKLRLESRGKNFKSDDIEDNTNKLVFNAVTGWVWEKDVTFKGAVPDFNQKTFNEVMNELPWFRNQLEEAISDEKAFFPI